MLLLECSRQLWRLKTQHDTGGPIDLVKKEETQNWIVEEILRETLIIETLIKFLEIKWEEVEEKVAEEVGLGSRQVVSNHLGLT
jgi:hypothetical protein